LSRLRFIAGISGGLHDVLQMRLGRMQWLMKDPKSEVAVKEAL